MKKIILLALILSGCVTEEERQQDNAQMRDRILMDLRYVKDVRTNLCFAYMFQVMGYGQSRVGGPAITNVPCEVVEELIENGQKKTWEER